MTDDELKAIRRNHEYHARRGDPGDWATRHIGVLLAEVDRLRVEVERPKEGD